jgi:hypothetical protein
MLSHKISGLPVTDAGELVGTITTSDILQAFLDVLGASEEGSSRIDLLLEEGPQSRACREHGRGRRRREGVETHRDSWDASRSAICTRVTTDRDRLAMHLRQKVTPRWVYTCETSQHIGQALITAGLEMGAAIRYEESSRTNAGAGGDCLDCLRRDAGAFPGIGALQSPHEHPHGLSDKDFDALFTKDKPIIVAFHGYPWLIHRLTYKRTNHENLHVRGNKEEGTPLHIKGVSANGRFHFPFFVGAERGDRGGSQVDGGCFGVLLTRGRRRPSSHWSAPRSRESCGGEKRPPFRPETELGVPARRSCLYANRLAQFAVRSADRGVRAKARSVVSDQLRRASRGAHID